MLGRAVNLYFITKYKNISTRKPKYCRAAMRIKEFILYGLKLRLLVYISKQGQKNLLKGAVSNDSIRLSNNVYLNSQISVWQV